MQMLGELGSEGSHGRSSHGAAHFLSPLKTALFPRAGTGRSCGASLRKGAAVLSTLIWKGLQSGHTVHGHASLGSLPVRVQSLNAVELVGLGKINHPYYKSSYLCVRRAMWTLNAES